MNPESYRRIAARGASLGLIAALIGTPAGSALGEDLPSIVTTGEMKSLRDNFLFSPSSPDVLVGEKIIKPDLVLFQEIIDSALNPNLLGPFLDQIHSDFAEDPNAHFKFYQELGGPGVSDQFVLSHPDFELIITDPRSSEEYLGQFTFIMLLHKKMGISISEGAPGLEYVLPRFFTYEEQMDALEFFNTSDMLRQQEWLPRQSMLPNGPEGVIRGYVDENNMLHSQDATVDGLITHIGTYQLSKAPGFSGLGTPSRTLISVQP